MDQEYTPEQELIRSNCFKWRSNTLLLIKEEKWDLIECNPCNRSICSVCQNNVIGESPLRDLLVFSHDNKMHHVHKVIERVYGNQSSNDWFKIILYNIPSFSKLKYFIENGLIDVNNGSYNNTLLTVYLNWSYDNDWEKKMDYLLSEKVGYNINIQQRDGDNSLFSFIRCCYDEFFEEGEDVLLKYNEKIVYLLEKGSDPLLPDKEGICILEYLKNLMSIEEHKKQELIQLIERYL
jgi:hypothetical protein